MPGPKLIAAICRLAERQELDIHAFLAPERSYYLPSEDGSELLFPNSEGHNDASALEKTENPLQKARHFPFPVEGMANSHHEATNSQSV